MIFRRILAEIRYSIQVDFLDNKGAKIKQYCPSEYRSWLIEHNQNDYKFSNNDKWNQTTEVFGFSPSHITFVVEAPPSDNYFVDKLRKLLKPALNWVDSDLIERIGIRQYAYYVLPNLSTYVNKATSEGIFSKAFAGKFIGQNSIEDLAVVLQSSKYRLQFGSSTKKEVTPYILEVNSKDKIPDQFAYVDCDCFEFKVEKKLVASCVEKLYGRCNELTQLTMRGMEV